MLVKVCGITTRENFEELVAASRSLSRGIDWYGLIFIARSSRRVADSEAALIAKFARDKGLLLAGVFENSSPEYVLDTIRTYNLAAVQLHGDEDARFMTRIKAETDAPIIKAYNINSLPEDIPYELIDYLLLDAPHKIIDGVMVRGGTGVSYDWREILELNLRGRVIMSGGIGPHNIEALLDFRSDFEFAGVDFNSKLESSVGIKDPEKVENILQVISCHKSDLQ